MRGRETSNDAPGGSLEAGIRSGEGKPQLNLVKFCSAEINFRAQRRRLRWGWQRLRLRQLQLQGQPLTLPFGSARSLDSTGGKGSHLVPRTDSSLCSWCMQLASSVCLFTQRAPRAATSAPAAFWTTCRIQRGSPKRSSPSNSVGSVEPHHQLRPNSLAARCLLETASSRQQLQSIRNIPWHGAPKEKCPETGRRYTGVEEEEETFRWV